MTNGPWGSRVPCFVCIVPRGTMCSSTWSAALAGTIFGGNHIWYLDRIWLASTEDMHGRIAIWIRGALTTTKELTHNSRRKEVSTDATTLTAEAKGSITLEAVEVVASAVVATTATTIKVAVTMRDVGTASHRINNHTTTTKTIGTATKVKGLLYLKSKPMEAPMHGTAMLVKHTICHQGNHHQVSGHQDNTDIHRKFHWLVDPNVLWMLMIVGQLQQITIESEVPMWI